MLEKVVREIVKGIEINGIRAYAKKITTGRFKDEVNLGIYGKEDSEEKFLLYVKVYYGREPYYRPWVEFFSINSHIGLKKSIEFFDSLIEENLLGFFSGPLGPGSKIYIEYLSDRETSYGLMHGFPPPITRLGYELFRLGFTWFKDWYFPEGGSEGGQKLQGEKPLNEEARKRHLRNIGSEVLFFMKIEAVTGESINEEYKRYLLRARDRAERLLKQVKCQHFKISRRQ